MELPVAFSERMKKKLGNEFLDFVNSLQHSPPVSIRLNYLKEFYLEENYGKVKWNSKKGIYFTKRPIFTLDPIFQAGGYYVQEASSMFVGEAIRQISDSNTSLKLVNLKERILFLHMIWL